MGPKLHVKAGNVVEPQQAIIAKNLTNINICMDNILPCNLFILLIIICCQLDLCINCGYYLIYVILMQVERHGLKDFFFGPKLPNRNILHSLHFIWLAFLCFSRYLQVIQRFNSKCLFQLAENIYVKHELNRAKANYTNYINYSSSFFLFSRYISFDI